MTNIEQRIEAYIRETLIRGIPLDVAADMLYKMFPGQRPLVAALVAEYQTERSAA